MTDALELELRQLAGVTFVAFGERDGAVVVELGVEPAANVEVLRADAMRVALGHLDGPVVVDLIGEGPATGLRSDRRVRILLAVPAGDGDDTEIHLAHQDRTVTVVAPAADRLAVANAVVDGLRRLGLAVPFDAVSAHALVDELGAGTLVLLRDARTGAERRGLAGGRTGAESTARAVLNGLNRLLQP